MEKTFTLPGSGYYSENFRQMWDEVMSLYSFKDSTNERTVKNYGSTVKLVCEFCKKDFLELTDEDAAAYYSHLSEMISSGKLSEATVHTYKKNLRSVGSYFEHMLEERGDAYINPFRGRIYTKKKKLKKDNDTASIPDKKDILRLLELIKLNEKPQYYYIFCIMTYFLKVTPVKICGMKAGDILIKGHKAEFTYEIGPRRPKTENPDRNFSNIQADACRVTYCLPEEVNAGFVEFYPEYVKKISSRLGAEPAAAFYNRNYEPVNFKTLGSIFRKNLKLLEKDRADISIHSIRDICGMLYSNKL